MLLGHLIPCIYSRTTNIQAVTAADQLSSIRCATGGTNNLCNAVTIRSFVGGEEIMAHTDGNAVRTDINTMFQIIKIGE